MGIFALCAEFLWTGNELMPTSRNSATGKVQACSTRPRREWDGSVSQVEEAENWLRGQTAYQDIPEGSTSSLAGSKERNTKRSDLNTNHAKVCHPKIIGTLSDVREVGISLPTRSLS